MPEAIAAPPAPAPAAPAPAPKPAAPAPKPAAPPPKPAAAPAEKPEARPEESFFDELDRIDKGQPKPSAPPQKPAQKPADGAAKPSDQTPPTSEQEKGEEGQSAQAASQAPEQKPPPKAAELRVAYEKAKGRVAELEKEVTTLKAKPVDDPEKKSLVEQLKSRDEQIQKMAEELRYSNYENTPEYKEKYEKPYLDAWMNGRARVAKMAVLDGEGNARQGTEADFDVLVKMNDDDAAEKAAELFGARSAQVLLMREAVLDKHNARVNAITEVKATAGEREKKRMEDMTRQQAERKQKHAELGEMFKRLNAETIEKYPDYFKAPEDDPEAKAAVEKGFAMADKAFSNMKDMKPEDAVRLHSAMRNKAGGYDLLFLKFKRSQAKVAELEKSLEEFKASEPAGGEARRGTPGSGPQSIDEEIDILDRGGK